MNITAKLRNLRIAPRKVRLVADSIRGLSVSDADRELTHLPKRSSKPLQKLLRSAVANAEHTFHLKKEDVRIKEIRVDQGPVFKRFMPRAMGRSATIRKRTSHISLVLAVREHSKTAHQDAK